MFLVPYVLGVQFHNRWRYIYIVHWLGGSLMQEHLKRASAEAKDSWKNTQRIF
jgi:hypothetical protein